MVLTFNSNIGETKKTVEQHGKFYEVTNLSDNFTYSQALTIKNDSIFLVKTKQDIDHFLYSTNIDINYSANVLQIPFPLQIGDTWQWEGYQIKNGDTTQVRFSGEAIGVENISVPAGNFETLKIKLEFNEFGGEQTTLYQWFAPNIGAVKTRAIIEGSGILQFAMSLLGYDEIDSELKEIKNLK